MREDRMNVDWWPNRNRGVVILWYTPASHLQSTKRGLDWLRTKRNCASNGRRRPMWRGLRWVSGIREWEQATQTMGYVGKTATSPCRNDLKVHVRRMVWFVGVLLKPLLKKTRRDRRCKVGRQINCQRDEWCRGGLRTAAISFHVNSSKRNQYLPTKTEGVSWNKLRASDKSS